MAASSMREAGGWGAKTGVPRNKQYEQLGNALFASSSCLILPKLFAPDHVQPEHFNCMCPAMREHLDHGATDLPSNVPTAE